MNNLKRFTTCKLLSHSWTKISYPVGPDGERAGSFLRCLRCGKEDHDAGTVPRGPNGAMAG
jgi:hypothetical protein